MMILVVLLLAVIAFAVAPGFMVWFTGLFGIAAVSFGGLLLAAGAIFLVCLIAYSVWLGISESRKVQLACSDGATSDRKSCQHCSREIPISEHHCRHCGKLTK